VIEVSIHYPYGRAVNEPSKDRVSMEFILPKRPFLFWSEHRIGEMLQYPKGYGVAYYDMLTDKVLMVMMPFNVLVGFAIWSYQWTRFGIAHWLVRHLPRWY